MWEGINFKNGQNLDIFGSYDVASVVSHCFWLELELIVGVIIFIFYGIAQLLSLHDSTKINWILVPTKNIGFLRLFFIRFLQTFFIGFLRLSFVGFLRIFIIGFLQGTTHRWVSTPPFDGSCPLDRCLLRVLHRISSDLIYRLSLDLLGRHSSALFHRLSSDLNHRLSSAETTICGQYHTNYDLKVDGP